MHTSTVVVCLTLPVLSATVLYAYAVAVSVLGFCLSPVSRLRQVPPGPVTTRNEGDQHSRFSTTDRITMDTNQLRVVLDEDGHKLVELPTGGRVAVPYDPLYAAEQAAAEAARAIDPPDELRCKYKSTRCLSSRAKKRNGELHSFCQMHRERANQNQRNSEQRKRSTKTRARRSSEQHKLTGNQWDPEVNDQDEEKHFGHLSLGTPPFHLPEPLQGDDSPHPEPTYDELKETALLLSFSDHDRE